MALNSELPVSELITATIAIINIIITIILTKVNYNNLRRANILANKREVVTKFYLPIKLRLIEIKIKIDNIKLNYPEFKISDDNNSVDEREAKKEILILYKNYLQNLNEIDYLFNDKVIDLLLSNIYIHMQHIILISELKYYNQNNNITDSKILDVDYKIVIEKIEEFTINVNANNFDKLIYRINKVKASLNFKKYEGDKQKSV